MQKLIIISFIFSLLSCLSAEVFNVIEQNEDNIIVEFILPDYEISQEVVNNDIYHRIILPKADQLLIQGLPQLPFFSTIIGIPSDGDITFQLISSEKEILHDLQVYPSEKISYQNDLPVYEFYEKRFNKDQAGYYPETFMLKGEKAFLKDRHLISLKINPFQSEIGTNNILVTKKAILQINISGDKTHNQFPGTALNNSVVDSGLILNNETSSNWRLPKPELASYPLRDDGMIDQIQLIIDSEGLYKIDHESLMQSLEDYSEENELETAYQFDWELLDPRFLELSDEHGPVPIYFYGENDGSFDPGDYFEFYGKIHLGDTSYYDDYSSENVYSLTLKDNFGSRLAVENGGLENSDPDQYIIPVSFQQNVHLEKQNFIEHLAAQFDFTANDYYREDIWFWEKISSPNLKVIPFDLQYPEETTIRSFSAQVSIFGSTYNPNNYNQHNHLASINLNSALIENRSWGGQTEVIFENEAPIPNSYLLHEENLLYINLPGMPDVLHDQILLDYVDLTYWREYKTDEEKIKFTKPQNKPFGLYQFQLENFRSDEVSVYKLGSSKMENVQVTNNIEGSLFTATFQDMVGSDDIEYFAVAETEKKYPISIQPDINSNLKDPANAANYVIITISDFVDSEGTLLFKQIWEEKGHEVMIVDLQDIFDEFNFGIRSAEAIKDFLAYCYNFWSEPELTHVMLLGDGILDERDNSSNREYNLIPFRRVWVQARGAIASDNWLACIIGDDPVPDLSIGRINVWLEEQILDVAYKSQHYLEEENYDDLWHSRVSLAAGGNPSEGTFFAQQSERVRNLWIPDRYNVNRIYCNTEDMPDEYHGNTTSLINDINDGILYLQFMGHGGGYVWADYNLLNKADIATFNNENYPFVSSPN